MVNYPLEISQFAIVVAPSKLLEIRLKNIGGRH
jgi:hypothetical protein